MAGAKGKAKAKAKVQPKVKAKAAPKAGQSTALLQRTPAGARPPVSTPLDAGRRDDVLRGLRCLHDKMLQTTIREAPKFQATVKALGEDATIQHPDKEVRMWAAKCLVEGLRMFVPDPPFEPPRLQLVLDLLIDQLGVVAEPQSILYVHAVGLLEKLTEMRCFFLIFDFPEQEEDLLIKLTSTCLAAARPITPEEARSGQIISMLAHLLTPILGEADSGVPKKVMKALVDELTPRLRNGAAADLVRRVLGGLANRTIVMLLNDYLNAGLYVREGDLDPSAPLARDGMEGLLGAACELYAVDPGFVARVIPNLQVDLQASDPERRRMVTVALGRMLAHRPATSYRPFLVSSHPLLRERFQERLSDAEESVRLAALSGAAAIIASAAEPPALPPTGGKDSKDHPQVEMAKGLAKASVDRCLDPSDTVRLQLIQLTCEVARSSTGLELLNPCLKEILRRVLDKRQRVREISCEATARLYAAHALPAWAERKCKKAQELKWAPQLLCEAYAVYAGGRLGHLSQLEELMEQHILGCGGTFQASERALALLGFCCSATSEEVSRRGFALLLQKKRDANAALRTYLCMRRQKEAPVLEATGAQGTLVLASTDAVEVDAAAASAVEGLARCSPALEDRAARPESMHTLLRTFDGVRDKALWSTLHRLTDPFGVEKVSDLKPLLEELDKLLRVHRLTELAPLLRRGLLSTWLVSEQVPTLLEAWEATGASVEDAELLNAAACQAFAELPRCFPGPFLQHLQVLVEHLPEGSSDNVPAALRALAALGKRIAAGELEAAAGLERESFVKQLIAAVSAAKDVKNRGSAARKALWATFLLPAGECQAAKQELLNWAAATMTDLSMVSEAAVAMQIAAACIQSPKHELDCDLEMMQLTAQQLVDRGQEVTIELYSAAADLLVAAGSEEQIRKLLEVSADAAPVEEAMTLQLVPARSSNCTGAHAGVVTLQAIRKGSLGLSTPLLTKLAQRICRCLAPDQSATEADKLAAVLQSLPKPPTVVQVKMADRLRLCSTLPAVFAFAQLKKHREAMQRMLQITLQKAARQRSARQEPLLDYVAACFIHFIAHLDCFLEEAAVAVTAYPQSTKVANFFCEALLRCEPQQCNELGTVVLKVCDRVRFFVDREEPTTDHIHRAAWVLRYAMEKKCLNLGKLDLAQGARGSMPSELYCVRQVAAPAAPPRALADAAAGGRATAQLALTAAGEGEASGKRALVSTDVAQVARPMAAQAGSKRPSGLPAPAAHRPRRS